MSAITKLGPAGSAASQDNVNPALPPQAPDNKGGQASGTTRRIACVYCNHKRRKCDYSDGKVPCTNCEEAGLVDCQPYQHNRPGPRPGIFKVSTSSTAASTGTHRSSPRRPASSGPPLGAFKIPASPTPAAPGSDQPSPLRPFSSPFPQRPRLANSSAPTPPTHAAAGAMSSGRPIRGSQRTPQEQADYEARHRFDNSDSESEGERPSSFRYQLSLRGEWAARETGARPIIEPQYQIPAGQTRTIADVVRAENALKATAPQAGPRTFAEIEADEEVVEDHLGRTPKKILVPDQILQLADDNDLALLEQTDLSAPLDVDTPPSNATPLTEVQLAAQELISKNKKRRRPKKKAKTVVELESVDNVESSDAQAASTPAASSATTSFQSATVEDDNEDGTSTARSTPPPARGITPTEGGVITAKPPRTRKKGKKNKGRKNQQSVEDGGLLPDQGERHYEDQPFLLCCSRVSVPHPINDRDHGDLMTLARRMAGTFPDQLVVASKVQYGVVWCDFNIIFGLAYHIKACGEKGINFYGTGDWASGEITEILVQAPETVSSVEAPRVQKECLVRQRHSVDFVCSGHDAHTFTLFEVQWQAQGEGKSREVIRKLCENTDRDFAETLRKYRIEKLNMHL